MAKKPRASASTIRTVNLPNGETVVTWSKWIVTKNDGSGKFAKSVNSYSSDRWTSQRKFARLFNREGDARNFAEEHDGTWKEVIVMERQ